jgi:hypothetical protein
MRWVGHVARMEEIRIICRILLGKLGRNKHALEDNIQVELSY